MPRPKGSKNKAKIIVENVDEKIVAVEAEIVEMTASLKAKKAELKAKIDGWNAEIAAAQAVVSSCTPESRIGIIGTKVTIASHAYKSFIEELKPELSIYETACPAFVPLIEEGIIRNDIMDMTIRYYMDDFVKENALDTVVLGCTHYPLIQENISRIYPGLSIINPSSIVVGQIERILTARDMHAMDSDFTNVFYASDLSENFINMIDYIFADVDEDKKVKFMNFDLEKERLNGLL